MGEEEEEVFLDGEKVVEKLKAAVAEGVSGNRYDLLQMAADEIRAVGGPYTSVYMYMLSSASPDSPSTALPVEYDRLSGGVLPGEGAPNLILEAFSGRPTEHLRIPVGRGVCGRAVALGRDQNVGNVNAYPGYIACNARTRSELVVLIRAPATSTSTSTDSSTATATATAGACTNTSTNTTASTVLGQIDVDSDRAGPFSAAEEANVRLVADALGSLLPLLSAASA